MVVRRSASSNSPLRVLIAMGTRPEIIKLAPVVWAGRASPRVEVIVCHSGQHADLAEPMLDYFDIRPDIRLELMRSYRSLPALIGGCMQRVDEVLERYQPDVVVVQGDTASAAAIAMTGCYRGLPVVHVEAGLRTRDLTSPWPEEINRRVASLMTELHCAPTRHAQAALLAEGIPAERIEVCGNPIVDALNWTLARESERCGLEASTSPLVVLTAHRRENFGAPLEAICQAVLELSERFLDHRFVFVTHPNPQAGPAVQRILAGKSRIEVAPPMGYPQFVRMMLDSRLIISDSGGIQEEAPTLKVPLLITRDCTERPEVIDCGAAELVGTDRLAVIERASRLLEDEQARGRMRAVRNPFGDGESGPRIMSHVVQRFIDGQFGSPSAQQTAKQRPSIKCP